MHRIVASIVTLQQHIVTLANSPAIYCPTSCPHCAFGKLWSHGCYERKADRQSPASESLNPVLIPRFICQGCHQTCSRLPECIAPRRWYGWTFQQMVLLMLLTDGSLRKGSRQFSLDRRTLRRWWTELKERHHKFQWFLRARFPELGRSVDFADFWCHCLQAMPLSQAMAWLDHDGVVVP
jgi:hypothetical protein